MLKQIFVWTLLISSNCFAEPLENLKLYSFRGFVSIFNGISHETIARGWKPTESPITFTVGRNSGVTFDGSDNETISIIGPALVHWEDQVGIKLEYGEILIRRPDSDSILGSALMVGESEISTEGFLEVLIEKTSQKGAVRIINLSAGALIFENNSISRNQIFVGSETHPLISSISENEKASYRLRHFNNRHNRALSQTDSSQTGNDPEMGAKPNPKFLEAGFLPSISKLYPTQGSTFGQNLGGLGVFAKLGSQSFWTLPKDETRRTRSHYMLAPSIRYGIGIQGLSLWMQTYPGFNTRNQSLSGQVFLGWGWQGLFVDAIGAAVWDLNTKLRKPFKLKYPWSLGADVGYRVDLLKYVDSDMGLLIGGRGIWSPMIRNSSVGSSQADASSPQAFSLVSYSIFAALSLRF